jgi:myo-inositol-1(or 4)-monophosphatase
MSADERIGTAERERLASDLALRGGRLALEYFHRAHVSAKPDGSLVTDADLAIQERLAAEIQRAFPDDAIIGEEAGLSTGPRHAIYRWVLDPVDGTNNFARGLPGFSVSIGVLRNGMPFAGAVYDPITRWLFAACAGRGAWLNDRPLRTSPAPLSAGSLIAVRTPFEDGIPPFVEDWLRRHRLRRFGSTALQLCYAAMGGLDLVYDHRASLWDIAGAAPVLLEAGGVLTLADGMPLFPVTAARRDSAPVALLAGNPTSHAQALADVTASTISR